MAIEQRQNVNAMSAHVEWACRPADERYQSVTSLRDVARARQRVSAAVNRKIEHFHFADHDGAVVMNGKGNTPVLLSNWSFQQACAIAGAPSNYLRTLPAGLAAQNLNAGMARPDMARDEHMLFVERISNNGPLCHETFQLRAITSPDYGRIYNADIADALVRVQESHPAWQLPMGYANGEWGGPLVPSGAYLGDRDMFVMLIDGNRSIDDPTDSSNQGLFRGIIVRNSEVGAAFLTLDMFYFRRVCGNNMIWGFKHVAGFRRRHVGTGQRIASEFQVAMRDVQRALQADTTADRAIIQRAIATQIAPTKEKVIDLVAQLPDVNQDIATRAYAMAEKESGLNPRSAWGAAQGLTYVSQTAGYQDARFDIDKAAAKVLVRYAS